MARSWDSSLVREMLARVDGDAAGGVAAFRPDDLAPEYGLQGDGNYRLSETQAQEILNMRLQRLTGLEQDKIIGEYKDVMATIADLLDILARRSASPRSSAKSCRPSRPSSRPRPRIRAAPKSKSTPPSSIPKT